MNLTELEKQFLNGCGYDETGYVTDEDVDYSDERMKGARVSLQNKGVLFVDDDDALVDTMFDINVKYESYLGFDRR